MRQPRRSERTTWGALLDLPHDNALVFYPTIDWVRVVALTYVPRPGDPNGDAVEVIYRRRFRRQHHRLLTGPDEPVWVRS